MLVIFQLKITRNKERERERERERENAKAYILSMSFNNKKDKKYAKTFLIQCELL